MENKKVELRKHHLDLHQFTSKDDTRLAINHIHIASQKAEATNGFMLVQVETEEDDGLDILIPADTAKAAARFPNTKVSATLPERVVDLSLEGDKGIIKHKPTEQEVSFDPRGVEKSGYPSVDFPQTEQVIPEVDDDWRSVCLDAKYLEQLARFVKQHGKNRVMRLYVSSNPAKAVVMKADTNVGQSITMILMPTRAHTPE